MTLNELSKLYYINKLIERDEERLSELEAYTLPGGINISDMPKTRSYKNTTEEIVPLIIETKERIQREKEAYIQEQAAIEEYINSIEDYQTRLIFLYRFANLMSWRKIAFKIGGNNTEDSVRQICHRFLKSQ